MWIGTGTTAAAKSLQSCPTLCDPIDSSTPGSPIPGILQARTLEWVAISFSNAWKWKVKMKSLSRVRLLATPWTSAYQAAPSMDFPGKSTGVGCHCLLLKKTAVNGPSEKFIAGNSWPVPQRHFKSEIYIFYFGIDTCIANLTKSNRCQFYPVD